MDFFLEIGGTRRRNGTEFLDGGLQQFRDKLLDLIAQSRIVQGFQQAWVFNVGKSAAEGAFHNIVVDHRLPRFVGEFAKWCAAEHACIRCSITEGWLISDSDNDRWRE
jgi:hypothetical protein